MSTAALPITVSTSLSIVLHGAVIAALFLAAEQSTTVQAVGSGVRVELISSIEVSDQLETDRPDNKQEKHQPERLKQSAMAQGKSEHEHSKHPDSNKKTENKRVIDDSLLDGPIDGSLDEPVLSVDKSNTVITQVKDNNVPVKVAAWKANEQQKDVEQRSDKVYEENNQADIVRSTSARSTNARSTNASQQNHSLLELLHSRISNKKVYPYLAQRQRREGTSTVEFILHPDGSIEGAQLLNSSRTELLDRAAISAVRDIEPFEAATEYLEQAERFQVDVVFSLL